MLADLATTYSDVFAPEFFLLACLLALVAGEWRAQSAPAARLAPRLGVVIGAWVVAYALDEALSGVLPAAAWASDVAASIAVLAGMTVIHAAWRARDWGTRVPTYTTVVLALSGVHLVVTPVWGFSSHVAYTAAPALVLTRDDRRYAPLLAVPVLMVPARPLAGEHTWPEAVGGLLVAVAVWYAVVRWPRT